jgi:hypothetical protein
VDVENLKPAKDSDAIFASVPLAQTAPFNLDTREQDETSGVSAFFGTWPGDESDEQLMDAVESIE